MKYAMLSVLLATGLWAQLSAEQFDLEVYASKFDSIPIGVIDFTPTDNQIIKKNEPGSVIAGDLDFCGRFIIMINGFPATGGKSINFKYLSFLDLYSIPEFITENFTSPTPFSSLPRIPRPQSCKNTNRK